MALSQVYTAVIGHVITAARWNTTNGNIYMGPMWRFSDNCLTGWIYVDAGWSRRDHLSTASQAFILTPGSKSGTPSINGNFSGGRDVY